MIKLSFLVVRRPDLTHQEFIDYWTTRHAKLALSLPEARQYVRRYVQQHVLNGLPDGLPMAEFDGIAEVWLDDVEAVMALLGSPNFTSVIAADEENFLDRQRTRISITSETEF